MCIMWVSELDLEVRAATTAWLSRRQWTARPFHALSYRIVAMTTGIWVCDIMRELRLHDTEGEGRKVRVGVQWEKEELVISEGEMSK